MMRKGKKMIAVVDTETTGLDPATASIVEIGVVTLPRFDSFSCLIKPDHAIEVQAMAAHHLTEKMVKEGAPLKNALLASRIMEADFICAHNAAFDMGFLKIDKPTICTYRCARHLWPDAPAYSNQVLRYWLELDDKLWEGDGKSIMMLPPHRALPDAWVTAHILHTMLLDTARTPQKLVELTKAPILMKTVGFGMHKGKAWDKVPKDYLTWILRQKDFDSDSVYTAKYHLGVK
jgi:exodeoxyribonuclease X